MPFKNRKKPTLGAPPHLPEHCSISVQRATKETPISQGKKAAEAPVPHHGGTFTNTLCVNAAAASLVQLVGGERPERDAGNRGPSRQCRGSQAQRHIYKQEHAAY